MASTLQVVVGQRLVRRICENCRFSVVKEVDELETQMKRAKEFFQNSTTLYQGKGCMICSNTGYHGRIAIFEFVPIDKEMQDLILKNPSSKQIWELARKNGSRSLFEDGIEKVKAGITTLEELLRVAEPPVY